MWELLVPIFLTVWLVAALALIGTLTPSTRNAWLLALVYAPLIGLVVTTLALPVALAVD